MSISRLIGHNAAYRAGLSMVRKGLSMQRGGGPSGDPVRRAGIINKVRVQTRGATGANNSRLFSKTTAAGLQRRKMAAMQMKAKRSSLNPAAFRQFQQSNQATKVRALQAARSKTIVKNVKSVTRSIHSGSELSKKTQTGRFSRHLLAQHLKAARKGPTQWGNTGKTFDLRRS